ncbi:hypothetical protein ACFSTI_32200 [Rhizorhabdus histidinilytica]
MSEPFDPADTDAWIAHGRSPVQAAALADAWRRFPDLANDSPLDQRMARMRERVTALRPVMEAMAHMVEAERQARNFAFTARRVAEGRGDDRDRAILRARDLHGHDWDRSVRYADGWYAAHAGWDPECRKPGPLDAGAEAYDHGFCDGGGNRDDLFDTARRALMVDRTPTSSAILPARPRPSEWLKPTDVPRPARWHRRLLLIGAPEAGLVAAPAKTALLRPALDSCSGCGEATIVVISGAGFHPLDRADTALPLGGPEALEVLASDRALQACLRALLGDRDFDDILVAAQGYYLALLDAHAAALPLCRTMERTRNTALQQRTHFRIWLDRGFLAGQTVGAGHIRWGKAVNGLTGRLGEFTARYAGKLPRAATASSSKPPTVSLPRASSRREASHWHGKPSSQIAPVCAARWQRACGHSAVQRGWHGQGQQTRQSREGTILWTPPAQGSFSMLLRHWMRESIRPVD